VHEQRLYIFRYLNILSHKSQIVARYQNQSISTVLALSPRLLICRPGQFVVLADSRDVSDQRSAAGASTRLPAMDALFKETSPTY
jgi:hypothetical protein